LRPWSNCCPEQGAEQLEAKDRKALKVFKNRHTTVVNLQSKQSVDVSIENRSGWSALQLAALRRGRMSLEALKFYF